MGTLGKIALVGFGVFTVLVIAGAVLVTKKVNDIMKEAAEEMSTMFNEDGTFKTADDLEKDAEDADSVAVEAATA